MQGNVTTTINNGLATITFSHPAHNSLPSNLLSDLVAAIDQAGQQSEVKLLLIQSEGNKTFCAGASFDELAAIEDLETGIKFFSGFANVINAIRTSPKIVLCRVHGKAIGGGVGLAAAADYSLATQFATIKLSELVIGIGPFVIGPAVQRKMGLAAFQQLALNAAEFQTAYWAKERGLFTEVFETVEQLDAYITYFVNILLTYNPEALSELKRVFWEGTNDWNTLLKERAAISGRLVLSDFTKEAIRAFKNRS
jgi:methylglutaconyl-CoA hydratase